MLQRYQDRGEKIIMQVNIQTKEYPNTVSRNVVAEVKGKEKPEKTVLVSGHIDSWDVGVGALDDGGGAFISWNALSVLRKLNLEAKRTVRAVLWTGEELGLIGVHAYNKAHKHELDNFTFVMESDEGTFTPLGLEYNTGTKGGCILKEIVQLFSSINATQVKYNGNGVGSDITIWSGKIPTASLLNANQNYFWYHHSKADTMDVLDSDTLDRCTALWTSVAYIIADLSEEFPRDFN
ncbi:unnamed protein product [Callosobruchus maculatus]|uniref:Carboxypeptidase Q n=1 Tax=Callosobruchus maculatus TaxID=64391 RepID=A0A653CUF1_CALMS|nr:unnamed protein product [Callosobruchus maculatus]